jgi:protein-tyrosine phosphatase
MQRHQAGETLDVATALHAMQETYRGFILDNTARYRSLFEHLLACDAPLVFHCTAGKDRTGLAAALILLALGVSRDDVMHDYLLTNHYLKVRHADAPGVPADVLLLLNQVREEFLGAAFEVIDQLHGSVDGYLETGLGVGPHERNRLAGMYLSGFVEPGAASAALST